MADATSFYFLTENDLKHFFKVAQQWPVENNVLVLLKFFKTKHSRTSQFQRSCLQIRLNK